MQAELVRAALADVVRNHPEKIGIQVGFKDLTPVLFNQV